VRAELCSDIPESLALMYYVPEGSSEGMLPEIVLEVCFRSMFWRCAPEYDRDSEICCVTLKYRRKQRQRTIPSGVGYLAKVEIVGVGWIFNLINVAVFCIVFNFAWTFRVWCSHHLT